MRINAALVKVGLAGSRRSAEELIKEAKVSLNDKLVEEFATQVTEGDELAVEDKKATFSAVLEREIVLLNKPIGYVCSHAAQKNQKTIFELLPREYANYKLAGRLDIDSTGLVLLSNDGELIYELTHPKFEHQKTYLVQTKQNITQADLDALIEPMEIDGKNIKAKKLRKIDAKTIEITIGEGINRQIRKMAGIVGLDVLSLERTSIGEYRLGELALGKWKKLP